MTDPEREESPPRHAGENSTNRLAVDIGGTFTDLVAILDGAVTKTKVPTTPDDLAEGVLAAVERSDVAPSAVAQFVHGTTIVINAITERSGVECALVTTAGFRDVPDITRANRPDMFNFRYEKPDPFVPRRHRWEVRERIDAAGEVLTPLAAADVRDAAREIEAAGIGSIAVSYINAYSNPVHERRTREIIAEEYPDAYVTLSHEITREYREYERTNTAVLNSYVHPIADTYLAELEDRLAAAGMDAPTYAMTSNGGIARFEHAKDRPIEMIESGPVGGVFGAARLGDELGRPDVISFDMGGTTAKTSLIEDGDVTINTDYWLERTTNREGYPVKVPVIDIVEIGAGGGSVAWIDRGGALKVGPESTGAVPGPACYGRGGDRPTVTDANLVVGRLNPEYFLGGEMRLDAEAARDTIRPLAEHFDTSVREAAHGIIRVVNSNMSNALKQVSIRRGHDPREFVLVASGGAGGLHAPALGRELGVAEIVIPRLPGQFSAWGMLMTDLRRDFIRTNVMPFGARTADRVREVCDELAANASRAFDDDLALDFSVDLRYVGQEHTVNTPMNHEEADEARIDRTIDRFGRLHEKTYNFRLDDPVEVVNFRLTATRAVAIPSIEPIEREGSVGEARKGSRTVDFDEDGECDAAVYERRDLPSDATIDGPAVIEEPSSTTIVHPDQRLRVDEFGTLRIS